MTLGETQRPPIFSVPPTETSGAQCPPSPPLWGQPTSWGNQYSDAPASLPLLLSAGQGGRVSQPQPKSLPVHTLVPAPATVGTLPRPPGGLSWCPGFIESPGLPRVTGLVDVSGQGLSGQPPLGDPQLEGTGGEVTLEPSSCNRSGAGRPDISIPDDSLPSAGIHLRLLGGQSPDGAVHGKCLLVQRSCLIPPVSLNCLTFQPHEEQKGK